MVEVVKYLFNLNRILIILENLLFMKLTWGFQESLSSSIIMPQNLVLDLQRIWNHLKDYRLSSNRI